MTYPSPDQWNQYAYQARLMASQYRIDALTVPEPLRSQWLERAEDCEDRAEFYEGRAYLEEWRLSRLNTRKEAA